MKNSILIGLLLLISTFNGCIEKSNKSTSKEINISVNELTLDSNRDIFQEINFIKLETNEDNPIGNVTWIKFINNNVLIFDDITQSLFLFTKEFKYVCRIRNIGKGPGQYRSISDVDVYNNNIILLVNRKEIMNFNLKGEFISSYKLPYFSDHIIYTKDGLLVLSEHNYLRKHAFLLDNNNSIINSYNEFSKYTNKYNFWPYNDLFRINDTVCYYLPEEYSVYQYSNNETRKLYSYNFTNIMPTLDQIINDGKDIEIKNIPWITGVYNVGDKLFTQFQFQGNGYCSLYTQSSGKMDLFRSDNFKDGIVNMGVLPLYIIGSDERNLYGTIPAYVLQRVLKTIPNNKFQNFGASLVADDNDVLIQFEVKL